MRRPYESILPDGGRLHLQDGPIDLVIEAWGERQEASAALAAAVHRMTGLLDALCAERALLDAPLESGARPPDGPVARRMVRAGRPAAAGMFITPMAAVAGAVADHVLAAMCEAASLEKDFVNNGGDVALHLAGTSTLTVGLVDRPDDPNLFGTMVLRSADRPRGIATSGRHGRSFSLGIADAVTVLADDATTADAAAIVIANAVDLPGHPAITRVPARDLRSNSDLGTLLVTQAVACLSPQEVRCALWAGQAVADDVRARDLCAAAALHLPGCTVASGSPRAAVARGRSALAHA